MKAIILLTAVLIGATFPVLANEDEWFVPLGRPPRATPRRISGGESFPPLPLPATPLRRSERKREPTPPKLIGKIVWGETASFAYDNGASTRISDWNLCPADIKQILNKTRNVMGLAYGSESVTLASFHGDPRKTPVLFLSGVRTVNLDDRQVDVLRAYVLNGGMLVCDSIAGSPYFYASIEKLMSKAFPEHRLRRLPQDHPLYHMVYDVDQVGYPRNLDSDQPFLEAIYVGCRAAVLVSRYGLGCGWDNREVPMLDKAVFYDVGSANKLGINIVAYAVGYSTVALQEAKPELFGTIDEKPPTSEFVFAQIRHEGAWNVHPGAASALMRTLRQNSSVDVNLKRVSVDLAKDDLASYTFLYLTGLDDFELSGEDVAALRTFLNASGTLLINNGLGLKTFDQAVRRELKKVLPEASLRPVPPDHPLFNMAFSIQEARYTPALSLSNKELGNCPYLEGIALDGDLRIIYSPYDVEAGWLGCEPPLSKGYKPYSAMRLGTNIVVYSVTH